MQRRHFLWMFMVLLSLRQETRPARRHARDREKLRRHAMNYGMHV